MPDTADRIARSAGITRGQAQWRMKRWPETRWFEPKQMTNHGRSANTPKPSHPWRRFIEGIKQ